MSAAEKTLSLFRPKASFGEMLRAARCGWAWSAAHGCYLRFSDVRPGRYLVEACPAELLPGDAREHRAWWEGSPERQAAFLAACAPLRGIFSPTQPFSWVVDDDGEVAR